MPRGRPSTLTITLAPDVRGTLLMARASPHFAPWMPTSPWQTTGHPGACHVAEICAPYLKLS